MVYGLHPKNYRSSTSLCCCGTATWIRDMDPHDLNAIDHSHSHVHRLHYKSTDPVLCDSMMHGFKVWILMLYMESMKILCKIIHHGHVSLTTPLLRNFCSLGKKQLCACFLLNREGSGGWVGALQLPKLQHLKPQPERKGQEDGCVCVHSNILH